MLFFFSSNFGHFFNRIVEKSIDFWRPGLGVGGGTGGFERGVEPGVEDLDGGVRCRGHARDSEDVGVVDGASVLGFGGVETRGGEHARELVGEDGDSDAGAAGDEAAGFDGAVRGGGGDAAADIGGDGVVGGSAEVFNVDVERAEVGD